MNKLKVKSKIYQYTGIYLAHKEANRFLTSPEFWKRFNESAKYYKINGMDAEDLQGLIFGTWECEQGFTRMLSYKYGFKALFNGPWYIKVLNWAHVFILQLFYDLYRGF